MWPFRKKKPGMADVLLKERGLFKEAGMFKFIKTDEEWIAAEVEKVAAEIKAGFEAKKAVLKAHITLIWDDALHTIEVGLIDAGMKLDDEAEAALTTLKTKLSNFKDTLEPKAPVDPMPPVDSTPPKVQ